MRAITVVSIIGSNLSVDAAVIAHTELHREMVATTYRINNFYIDRHGGHGVYSRRNMKLGRCYQQRGRPAALYIISPAVLANHTVRRFVRCLDHVEAWTKVSRLRLNPHKRS